MVNLPRVFVASVISASSLMEGKNAQCALCKPGVENEGFKRRDQRVSSEQSGKPGNARGDSSITAIRKPQCVEILDGSVQHRVECVVVRAKEGAFLLPHRKLGV